MTPKVPTAPQMLIMNTTQDTLLGGRVKICQPSEGYRVAIDPIFLAASVPIQPGESILDIGTGVGAAILCLAHRVPYARIVGLEIERQLVRLAAFNIQQNGFQQFVEVLNGDLSRPPPRLAPSTFDHVMTNPPFFQAHQGRVPSNYLKSVSNVELTATLKTWVTSALLMVKPQGSVTFVYTTDRLDELLYHLHGRLKSISIFPLWPKENVSAKRVIVQGVKEGRGGLKILPGLVIHKEDGKYTSQAEEILRHGKGLTI